MPGMKLASGDLPIRLTNKPGVTRPYERSEEQNPPPDTSAYDQNSCD